MRGTRASGEITTSMAKARIGMPMARCTRAFGRITPGMAKDNIKPLMATATVALIETIRSMEPVQKYLVKA